MLKKKKEKQNESEKENHNDLNTSDVIKEKPALDNITEKSPKKEEKKKEEESPEKKEKDKREKSAKVHIKSAIIYFFSFYNYYIIVARTKCDRYLNLI